METASEREEALVGLTDRAFRAGGAELVELEGVAERLASAASRLVNVQQVTCDYVASEYAVCSHLAFDGALPEFVDDDRRRVGCWRCERFVKAREVHVQECPVVLRIGAAVPDEGD